jgi:integrase
MGASTLAQSLAVSEASGRRLLELHRQTYPGFWRWSAAAIDQAMLRGRLWTVFGWQVHVGADSNPRSLANFPVQANGAEMLRLACCLATERGIRVCAPVHDALLVEAPTDCIDDVVRATLHNMLNKGVEWKRIGRNPIAGIKPLPHDKPRKKRRSLMLAEVQAILDASPEYLKPVWLTYMTTGIRRSELVNLTFKDIDFQHNILTIPASLAKNHKGREIPLDDTVVAAITQLRDQAKRRGPVPGSTPAQTAKQAAKMSKEHIFVSKANTPLHNNLLTRFYAVCKRAGIEDGRPGGSIDIHALRVSFITLALEHGGSPKAIQMIVGHSSLEMTMNIYAKATDRSKRDAVAALPFAKVSTPAHIIPMQHAHRMRTSKLESPEDKVG